MNREENYDKIVSRNGGISMDVEEKMDGRMEDLIVAIGKLMAEEDAKTSIINQNRLREIKFVYDVVKTMFLKQGMDLTYELNAPLKSMASVSLTGEDLCFSNAEWFSRVAEFSDTIDVEPLVNGKVRLTFGFHGLTTPIE